MALRVATDFSGMESPLVALEQLKVEVFHEFSSDTCPHARRVIQTRFSPQRVFGDVLKRDSKDLPRNIDIYVAGFPCPAFSTLSNLRGWHKTDARPLRYFKQCVKVILKCNPKVFVLENVKAITSAREGKIHRSINSFLKRYCSQNYHIVGHILNTKDYGIPQNRERLYIIGLHKSIALSPLTCPRPVPLKIKFADLLEKGGKRRSISISLQTKLDACASLYDKHVFISPKIVTMVCSGSTVPSCLTRGGMGLYWSKNRQLTTVREELRLQGFPDSFTFPKGMSDSSCRELIGNSMSVNVLQALFARIFEDTSLLKKSYSGYFDV